jgi:hypothetical protein
MNKKRTGPKTGPVQGEEQILGGVGSAGSREGLMRETIL